MRYHVQFMNDQVGQTHLGPFDVDVPDGTGVGQATVDLQRQVRQVVTERLSIAGAPGAVAALGVLETHTQILVSLSRGEGSAYYGTTTLGHFTIRAIP